MSEQKKVIFIVGPTASGKSNLSYQIIENYGGVIVNCDSLQVYESLNIGSAKPTTKEMSSCPHYLFGHVKDGDEYTAGRFRKDAVHLLENTDHSLYVFVGGSGFYIQALVKGMFEEAPIKQEAKEQVKAKKEELGKKGLFLYLQKLDPIYAKSIHENDIYRVSRALELNVSLGKTMGQIQQEFGQRPNDFSYPFVYLGVNSDREELKKKIEIRLNQMLKSGFRQEVESLIGKGLQDWKPLQSVGYKEMMAWVLGEIDEAHFREEIIKNTMRLAKRQMTWFKRNKEIHWFDGNKLNLDPIKDILPEFLSV